MDIKRTIVNEYDGSGNLLNQVGVIDNGFDGTLDSRFITSNEYDASGNLLSEVSENDNDFDGTVDNRSTTTNTFDPSCIESIESIEIVPTMGEWAIINLSLIFCIFGVGAIRHERFGVPPTA